MSGAYQNKQNRTPFLTMLDECKLKPWRNFFMNRSVMLVSNECRATARVHPCGRPGSYGCTVSQDERSRCVEMMSDENNQQTGNQEGKQDQPGDQQPTIQTEYGTRIDQGEAGEQGDQEGYSHFGLHGDFPEEGTPPDGYGPQDQFGDLDNQDPYSKPV